MEGSSGSPVTVELDRPRGIPMSVIITNPDYQPPPKPEIEKSRSLENLNDPNDSDGSGSRLMTDFLKITGADGTVF